jgi:hypothetical protein
VLLAEGATATLGRLAIVRSSLLELPLELEHDAQVIDRQQRAAAVDAMYSATSLGGLAEVRLRLFMLDSDQEEHAMDQPATFAGQGGVGCGGYKNQNLTRAGIVVRRPESTPVGVGAQTVCDSGPDRSAM